MTAAVERTNDWWTDDRGRQAWRIYYSWHASPLLVSLEAFCHRHCRGGAHLFSRGESALRDIWREPSGELEGERAIRIGTGIAAVCRAPNEIATAALKRMAGRTRDFPFTLSQVITSTSFRADFFFLFHTADAQKCSPISRTCIVW